MTKIPPIRAAAAAPHHDGGAPACFTRLLHQAASNRQLSEETAAAEMVSILRGFAQRHDEFLREQECEPAHPGE